MSSIWGMQTSVISEANVFVFNACWRQSALINENVKVKTLQSSHLPVAPSPQHSTYSTSSLVLTRNLSCNMSQSPCSFRSGNPSTVLPVELWDQVLLYLPKSSQKECMFVCRSWRRACRRALFTVIRLSVGTDCEGDRMEPDEVKEVVKAWEILDCIGSDPAFAWGVKTIAVMSWRYSMSTFETCTCFHFSCESALCGLIPLIILSGVMQKALRALPHLRSFQWFSWMDIPQGIQDTLESDIPNLPELRIFEYVSCPASHAVAHRLESPQVLHTLDLRQLRSLSCLVPRGMIDLEEPARDTCCTLDLVTANLNTLQELALDGILSLPWNLPVRTFENLKDLTLVALRDLHGLELVLRHSSNLESFIVENTRDDQLFSILAQNASSIPLLSSLKIISSGDWFHEESHYLALSMFLQDRRHIRRLDIHMIAPIQVVMIILPTLLSFKRLSALGLSLTSSAFPGMPVDYTSLPQFLSDSLEAVRFRVFLEEAVLDRGPFLPVVCISRPTLKSLLNLSFFLFCRWNAWQRCHLSAIFRYKKMALVNCGL